MLEGVAIVLVASVAFVAFHLCIQGAKDAEAQREPWRRRVMYFMAATAALAGVAVVAVILASRLGAE